MLSIIDLISAQGISALWRIALSSKPSIGTPERRADSFYWASSQADNRAVE